MGVTGLLPLLKEIQDTTSLEKFRGKTLAIDTYGWLHRGLISCAQELCQGQPTRKYITSIMKKVDMLRHFGVEPYFVFDGASLPTKAETAKERRVRREEAQLKAREYTRSGNTKLAWKEYMKAACVTHEMAKSIMVELEQRGIKYVVAPYEADPQMVYLEKIGVVDGILSEDSDLLVFGCNRLITKLKDDASCVEICRTRFGDVKSLPFLNNMSEEQIRLVAMLSGCDYTKGIPGVGLKSAFNLVKKFNNLEKVLIALRSDGKAVPPDFLDEVYKANLAFQFQKVFDPKNQILCTMNEYPPDFEYDLEVLESCCGLTLNNELYRKICNGIVHANNHEPLVSREQNLSMLKSNSVNLGTGKHPEKVVAARRTKSSPPKMRSVLDLLKTSKVTTQPAVPTTPSRGIKRVAVVLSPSKKLSPTSKKLIRINGEPTSPSRKQSKYFSTTPPLKESSLPTPISGKQTAAWDSSMLSGDSDFSEFSSPMNQKTQPRSASQVEVNLTDNDDEDMSNEAIEDSLPKDITTNILTQDNGFEVDESQDEIEESPMKPTAPVDKVSKFLALRQSFSYQETMSRQSLKLDISFAKKVPTPPNSDELQEEDFEISEDESQPKPASKPVLTPANLNTQIKFASSCGSDKAQEPTKKQGHINLKQFAFRG